MKTLVIANPRSGFGKANCDLSARLRSVWPGELRVHVSQSKQDSAEQIAAGGFDTLLVAGGDGMINSIGGQLLGSEIPLGVLPTGSGNGFARHFGIPLNIEQAATALANGSVVQMDAGTVNGVPFFVTASFAWDAALVETYERMPMRGVPSYGVAGMVEFFRYEPQAFRVTYDDGTEEDFKRPILFTVANLTQFGGGAVVAPQALMNDGLLDLVAIEQSNIPSIIWRVRAFFERRWHETDAVLCRRFRKLTMTRAAPGPIQIDGEIMEAAATVEVEVREAALRVLVPTTEHDR